MKMDNVGHHSAFEMVRDVMPSQPNERMSTIRSERLKRISPFWDDLYRNEKPNELSKENLLTVLADLKDEGNNCFRENNLQEACKFYSVALNSLDLLEKIYIYRDNLVKSVIFANKACCYLKLGFFEEALDDCNLAIKANPHNDKAYYRKACLLRKFGRLKDAYNAISIAEEINQDDRAIQKCFTEIKLSLIEEQSQTNYSQHSATIITKADAYDLPKTNLKETEETAENQVMDNTKKKHKNQKKRKKTMASNDVSKNMTYNDKRSIGSVESVYAALSMTGDSDEDECSQDKFHSVEVTGVNSEPYLTDKQISSLIKNGIETYTGGRKKYHNTSSAGASSLDNFHVPENTKGWEHIKSKAQKNYIDQRNLLPDPFHNYEFRFGCDRCYIKRRDGEGGSTFKPRLEHNCSQEYLLVRNIKSSDVTAWIKIRPRPLRVRQNFSSDFTQTWNLDMEKFQGQFKQCKQYHNGMPCLIGEKNCTFGHTVLEVKFWDEDRLGVFKIQEFISKKGIVPDKFQGHSLSLNSKSVSLPCISNPTPIEPTSDHPYSNSVRPHLLPTPTNWAKAVTSPKKTIPPTEATETRTHIYATSPKKTIPPTEATRMSSRFNASLSNVGKIDFPIKEKYEWKLSCSECLKDGVKLGDWIQMDINHVCNEDRLAVKRRADNKCFHVREKQNLFHFSGKVAFCHHFTKGYPCRTSTTNCTFAHNEPEQILWTLEKDYGSFSVTKFIKDHQSIRDSNVPGYTSLELIFKKHGGNLAFVCMKCYFLKSCVSHKSGYDDNLCRKGLHNWLEERVLAHRNINGEINVILPRPFKSKTAYFTMCRYLQYCDKRMMGTCIRSHAIVEQDIWLLERDTEITHGELARAWMDMDRIYNHKMISAAPAQSPLPNPIQNIAQPKHICCPYHVIFICELCWKKGELHEKSPESTKCNGKSPGHEFEINKKLMLLPSKKIIASKPDLPSHIKRFFMCENMNAKMNCRRYGRCTFAHSEEECEIWTWMSRFNIQTFTDLVKVSALTFLNPTKANIKSGVSVITAQQTTISPVYTPVSHLFGGLQNRSDFYCKYCALTCNGEMQWEQHCSGQSHLFNVNSDKERQWNYRQPPWGSLNGTYRLCTWHQSNKCRYSHVHDMYNNCNFAHNQEELDEWTERYKWRKLKRQMAMKSGHFSYMDMLVEEYENADTTINVVTEKMDSVLVKVNSDLKLFRENKTDEHAWLFEIKTMNGLKLNKVALMFNKDRLHFSLAGSGQDASQLAHGDLFEKSIGGEIVYHVEVKFHAGIFGSFSQWVVFDFGSKPVLVQKFQVDVGSKTIHHKVQQVRQKLSFNRWTSENCEIVKFGRDFQNIEDKDLARQYRPPSNVDDVVNQRTLTEMRNEHNYVHKMHQMLKLEEFTRHRIISNFNVKVTVELQDKIEETTYLFANKNELFARVPLQEDLRSDTDAGNLILTSVRHVLVGIHLSESSNLTIKVYEAMLVEKENFGFDGRGRDYIYICLSQQCVKELILNSGDEVDMEVQFQLNRTHFCEMHYVLDKLPNTNLLYPDIAKIKPQWVEPLQLNISSNILNKDQMDVITHMVSNTVGDAAPLIIYGPFGTGKTETIAQGVMLLLKQTPSARILICTHSNSAADLYILKHLHEFIQNGNKHVKMCRLIQKARRIETVDEKVLQYCCLSTNKCTFIYPTKEMLMQCHIILTTMTMSVCLINRKMQGYFTHILLDETAQAMESEAIMPLTLANGKTCVVMAGDYMQISPKIYSTEAKDQGFQQSLLERLYKHYESHAQHLSKNFGLKLLLTFNYRAKMEILRFISAVFYGGPERLIAASLQPNVPTVQPLAFYVTRGREVQDSDSTSFYNAAEIDEIVSRVEELYDSWPVEWGERRADQIGVITPYYDQVLRIRHALRRKRKNQHLKAVTVERVQNVQGKEFRAVFISTVRTRHLAERPPTRKCDTTGCDGENGNFGFLSDQKLLNTAFTRAKSLVAVVGDPVGLSAIGDCMTIWRTFLKHCSNLNSIHPREVTFNGIKSDVISLHNTPEIGNNIAILNDPSLQQEGEEMIQISSFQDNEPLEETSSNNGLLCDIDYYDEEIVLDADRVIQDLASDELHRMVKQGQVNKKFMDKNVHLHCYNGHILVKYRTDDCENNNLKSYGFDSDESLDHDDNERGNLPDLDPLVLEQKVQSNPNRYKKCLLKIGSRGDLFAELTEPSDELFIVKIASRLRCGQACVGDLVVIEILQKDKDFDVFELQNSSVAHGRVIGILKHALDPTNRRFVCTVETGNCSLMVPLNQGVHKIYNLETKYHVTQSKKGCVTVYKVTDTNAVKFSHYEYIEPTDPNSKLFVVQYLRWEKKFHAPIGVVTRVIQAATTIDLGIRALQIEHNMKLKFPHDVMDDIQYRFPVGFFLTVSAREDYRDKLTFTIDSATQEDLEDALSIEDVGNGVHIIGVHISDVSEFVTKDSDVDLEACKRFISSYPIGQDPVRIIPDRLSVDLCSLKPNQDRLAVSLLLTVDKEGEILNCEIKKTIVKSNIRLTFKEAQQHLKGEESDVNNALVTLHKIAQIWHEKRLGKERLYHPIEEIDETTIHVLKLLEEIKIQANHEVAKFLLEKLPNLVPILFQTPPEEAKMISWCNKHGGDALNSVVMTRPFLPPGWVCECEDICHCITTEIGEVAVSQTMDIRTDVWSMLQSAVDLETVVRLVVSPEVHPKLAIAWLQLLDIQKPEQYASSHDVPEEFRWHNSLNLKPYTHFTSPLHQYIDVVVQRLLKAVISQEQVQYSRRNIHQLCDKMTWTVSSAEKYEEKSLSLHVASALRTRPLVNFSVISKIETDLSIIFLKFPTLLRNVDYPDSLDVAELLPSLPIIRDTVNGRLLVEWEKRVYDLNPCQELLENLSRQKDVWLNPNRFVKQIPSDCWQDLLHSVVEGNVEEISEDLRSMRSALCNQPGADFFCSDILSDTIDNSESFVMRDSRRLKKYFCQFKMILQIGQVIQVQISTRMLNGMLTPRIQLFNISPTLCFCMEHTTEPTQCFEQNLATQSAKQQYTNEADYVDIWSPILHMEILHRAVHTGASVTIHNITIHWKTLSHEENTAYSGQFDIPKVFCSKRNIVFAKLKDPENIGDFFCIRYTGLNADAGHPDAACAIDPKTDGPITFVIHAHCTAVVPRHNNYAVTVEFMVQDRPMPPQLLDDALSIPCTFEMISISDADCQIYRSLKNLNDASSLARDIAVARKSSVPVERLQSTVLELLNGFPVPNQNQAKAFQSAVRQKFTVIHGSPGSGKTETAIRIIHTFSSRNRGANSGLQVYVCTALESSLDVIVDGLKRIGKECPKFVRVYSEACEETDYPLPNDVTPPSVKSNTKLKVKANHVGIAVHHMIRTNDHPNGRNFLDNDYAFNHGAELQNKHGDLAAFRQQLTRAMIQEIQRAEVVLCTSSTFMRPIISQAHLGKSIKQLLIDDSSSCSEPETVAIIAHSHAEQVVLIGDSNQIKPRVLCPEAKSLGLQKSLFARYDDSAVRLESQYRMHEAIASFPSKYIYDNTLKCCNDAVQRKASHFGFWPGGTKNPIAFCHLVGREECLTVPTLDGMKASFHNQYEVQFAVLFVSELMTRYSVVPSSIAVITMYDCQCDELQKQWAEKDITKRSSKSNVTITTVSSCQGKEWDYVIFSTVRSCPSCEIEKHSTPSWRKCHLGPLDEQNLVNIVITRAKKGLIILGNQNLLRCSSVWKDLIFEYKKKCAVINASEFVAKVQMQSINK